MQQLKQEIAQTTSTCLHTMESFTSQAALLSKRKRAKPTDAEEATSTYVDSNPSNIDSASASASASASTSASASASTTNQMPLVLQQATIYTSPTHAYIFDEMKNVNLTELIQVWFQYRLHLESPTNWHVVNSSQSQKNKIKNVSIDNTFPISHLLRN